MKQMKIVPILALLIIGLMTSCSSEIESLELEEENLIITQSKSSILPVNLGLSGDFAILSKTGITNVPPSVITGNVGTSPITGAALLLTCNQVSGTIYTVDAAGPLPCRVTDASGLTTAVLNMQAAYTDAAGRANPDYLNEGAGIIGGLKLAPGLHKWTNTLLISSDITLEGGPEDIWIFQVSGTLTMSSAVSMNLSGGAQAKNIFWQVSGAVTLGTTSHFEGNVLGATSIAVQTGATVNGRLLAQTAVTLQMNTVGIDDSDDNDDQVLDGCGIYWIENYTSSDVLSYYFSETNNGVSFSDGSLIVLNSTGTCGRYPFFVGGCSPSVGSECYCGSSDENGYPIECAIDEIQYNAIKSFLENFVDSSLAPSTSRVVNPFEVVKKQQ